MTKTMNDRETILKERAKILAREPEIRQREIHYVSIVEFLIDQDRYGIPADCVCEVYLLKGITTIPGVPEYVVGIINVRGQIFSVIDIKALFNIPKGKGISHLNEVIIIHNETMEFGIVVDSIAGITSIPSHKITPAPLTMTEFVRKYIKELRITI